MLVLLGNVDLNPQICPCPFDSQPVFAAVALPIKSGLPMIFVNGLGNSAIGQNWISIPGHGPAWAAFLTATVA